MNRTHKLSVGLACLAALAGSLLAPAAARAQADKVQLYYTYEPLASADAITELAKDADAYKKAVDRVNSLTLNPQKKAGEPDAKLSVRPNVQLPLYLYLEHDLKAAQDGTVELSRVAAKGGKAIPFATATIRVPEKKKPGTAGEELLNKTLVTNWTLAGAQPKPAAPPPGQPAPPPPPAPELDVPFQIEVKVKLADLDAVVYRIGLTFFRPEHYLIPNPKAYNPKTRELSVEIKYNAERGVPLTPPCPVTLDLDNSPHPMLVRPIPRTDARLTGLITPKTPSVTVRAAGLTLRAPGKGEKSRGPLYVSADGCPRAFAFETTFNEKIEWYRDEVVHLVVDEYVKAADTTTVRVETDNIDWDTDTVLKVAMDVDKNKDFSEDETQTFVTPCELRVQMLPPAENGAVQFQTLVKDWEVTFPTKGMFGPVALRAWLLNSADGKARKFKDEPIVDDRTIIIDGTAPKQVGFVDMEKVYPVGKPIPVLATGVDTESDIKEVWFGVAPVTGDAKWKKDAVLARKHQTRKDVWVADLDLGPALTGQVELGVLFVNRAGMTETGTQKVALVVPSTTGGPTGKKLGTIYAVVVEGELAQNDLEVALFDKDGKEVKRDKTADQADAKGAKQHGLAVFKDVEPGKYTLTTAKSASRTTGMSTVEVKEGEKKNVAIKLYRP